MKAIKKLRDLPFYLSLFSVLAASITLICLLIFIVGQQIYRQSANDPQIQISEDMANYASSGQDLMGVVPKSEVDISKSLVWFVIFYDNNGQVIASNAKLDGQTPVLPQGVLDNAKQIGQNRRTWEPKEGVRIAAVITKYGEGSVLVGRNLRVSEERIMMLGKKVLIAWIVILALVFLKSWFLFPKIK